MRQDVEAVFGNCINERTRLNFADKNTTKTFNVSVQSEGEGWWLRTLNDAGCRTWILRLGSQLIRESMGQKPRSGDQSKAGLGF